MVQIVTPGRITPIVNSGEARKIPNFIQVNAMCDCL